MDITSAKYQAEDGKNTGITAVVNGTTWHTPLDPANRHWIAIQKWVAEGNTIAEAD